MDVAGIVVRDVSLENIEDVFQVCSHSGSPSGWGREVKRRWIAEATEGLGPVSKVAYLNGKPVAQALFIPEEAVPSVEHPRRGVLQLRCVYNPFPEARGKGAATALVKDLIADCRTGLRSLKGAPCIFIAAEAFNTGEGTSLHAFYSELGFREGVGELYYPVTGTYAPRIKSRYKPGNGDSGRAYVVYNPTCEWLPAFAEKVKVLIGEAVPCMETILIDEWENPEESIRLGNHWLTVNGVQVQGTWTEKDRLREEIRRAAGAHP